MLRDSWSRPSKHQSVPAPFYLLPGGDITPYCHSCGRVINSRRKAQPSAKEDTDNKTPVKYCSTSCRCRKPGKVDREIENVLLRFRKQLSRIISTASRRNPSLIYEDLNIKATVKLLALESAILTLNTPSLAHLGWKCSFVSFLMADPESCSAR